MMYVVNKHVSGEVRAFHIPESMVEDDLFHHETEREQFGLPTHIKRMDGSIIVLKENEDFFYYPDKPSRDRKVMELLNEPC